jgi:hypothetical protein
MCKINKNVKIWKRVCLCVYIHTHTHTYMYCSTQNLVVWCYYSHVFYPENISDTQQNTSYRSLKKHIDHATAMLKIACRTPLHWKISCRGQVFILWQCITNVRNTCSPVDCTAVPKPVVIQKYKGYCCVNWNMWPWTQIYSDKHMIKICFL